MISGPQQMSGHPIVILHHTMDGSEPSQMSGRLETAYLPLALSRRLMRGLSAMVRVLVRDVNDRRYHGPAGRRVAPKLVGDQPVGNTALAL